MNLHDWLHIDLGALLRGRKEVLPPRHVRLKTEPRPPRGTLPEIFRLPFQLIGDLFGFLFGGIMQSRKRVNLISVTDQLARVIACNSPLVPAIAALMADAPNRRIWRVLRDLRFYVEQGFALSDAMRRLDWFFPQFYVDMVKAGEDAGSLYPCLCELSELLGDISTSRDSLRRCVAYFCLMLFAGGSIVTFLCLKVFPVFVQILADFGSPAPPVMRGVLRFADFMQYRLWCVLLAISALVVFWRICRRIARKSTVYRQNLSPHLGRLLVRIPIVGSMVSQSNMAQVARVMAQLLKAGYTTDEALADAASSDIRPVFAHALLRVHKHVCQGESLSQAMKSERPMIPASFRAIVALGEQSGRVPEALERLAHFYQRRVLKRTQMAMGALFPLMIISLGCCVLTLSLAVYTTTTALIDAMIL